MKKFLVTGGAGYIGSHMVWMLLNSGFEVEVWDNFSTGYSQPLEILKSEVNGDLLSWQQIDLRDRQLVTEKMQKFDGVFHFAAKCLVDQSMKNPGEYFENNVQGTVNLLDAMDTQGVEKIVFSSTCAVYGEGKYFPVDEKHPCAPTNPYGESKLMAENIINWYHRLEKLNYVILRYFNVCGAHDQGLIGDSKRPSTLLVQNAVRGALAIDDFYLTCPTVATEDGTPVRDYIDVLDLCAAHLKGFEFMLNNQRSAIFNLGNGRGVSVKEIVTAVKDHLAVDFEVNQDSQKVRAGEYAKVFADITKGQRDLGWNPERSLAQSINSLVKWYREYPQGYDN